jgi:hypothetical protein
MRSVFVAALTAGGLWALSDHLPAARASMQENTATAAPWQAGRCYRVFPSDPDTFHTFKVLEPTAGMWARVQPAPPLPPVPGGRPQAPLWVNTSSVFAVQEWTCN